MATLSTRSRCLRGLLLALLMPLAAQATEPPELDAAQAVRLALAQPEVESAAAARLALARAELAAATTWPNPELSVGTERGRGELSGAEETDLLLSQRFELGGSRRLEREAAALGIDAADAEGLQLRREIAAAVRQRFHDAVAAAQREASAAALVEALATLAEVAARRAEAGDLSGFARERIAQVAAAARLRHGQRAAEAQAAREQLAAWVGEPARRALLRVEPPQPPAPRAGDLDDSHPALAALAARKAEAEVAARAASRPRLPLELGIGRKRIEAPGSSEHALLLQASIPLPLFDRNQAEAARADAEATLARARLERARRELGAGRAAARATATQLVAAAAEYREQLAPQARRLAEVAARSFAAGEMDLPGLIDTLDALAETEGRAIDLQHRAQLALVQLDLLDPGAMP